MIRLLLISALFALSGCGAQYPVIGPIKTVTVDVPTPVSCVPGDYSPPPASGVTKEALLAAPDAAARYQLLAEFWTAEAPVLQAQAGVIAACQLSNK